MKKIVMLLAFIALSVISFAQLNIVSSDNSEIISKNYYCSTTFNNDFCVNIFDIDTREVLVINLGSDTISIIQSLNDLLSFYQNSKKNEFIEIVDKNNVPLTLMKKGGCLVVSNGNSEFIRKKMNNIIASATIGHPNADKSYRYNIGYLYKKVLEESIEKLSNNI